MKTMHFCFQMNGALSPENLHGLVVFSSEGNSSWHMLAAYTGAAKSWVFL